jgi:hypothetical protein
MKKLLLLSIVLLTRGLLLSGSAAQDRITMFNKTTGRQFTFKGTGTILFNLKGDTVRYDSWLNFCTDTSFNIAFQGKDSVDLPFRKLTAIKFDKGKEGPYVLIVAGGLALMAGLDIGSSDSTGEGGEILPPFIISGVGCIALGAMILKHKNEKIIVYDLGEWTMKRTHAEMDWHRRLRRHFQLTAQKLYT